MTAMTGLCVGRDCGEKVEAWADIYSAGVAGSSLGQGKGSDDAGVVVVVVDRG